MLGISQTVPGLTAFRPFLWRVSMAADRVVPPAVRAAVRSVGATTAFVVSSRDELLNRAEAEVFAATFKDLGVTVLGRASYVSGQVDLGPVLAAAVAARPDVLAISALPEDALNLLGQARAAGLTMPIVGGNGFNSSAVLERAGPAAEGLFVGSAWSIDSPDPENQRFVAAYRLRTGHDPDQFVAQAYAGMQVLAEAVRRGGPTRRGIQRGLGSIQHLPTVLGTFDFDENRDAVHQSWIRVVYQGRFVTSPA
jgi:branched-chain amino acid transport system substrate-binding protein